MGPFETTFPVDMFSPHHKRIKANNSKKAFTSTFGGILSSLSQVIKSAELLYSFNTEES